MIGQTFEIPVLGYKLPFTVLSKTGRKENEFIVWTELMFTMRAVVDLMPYQAAIKLATEGKAYVSELITKNDEWFCYVLPLTADHVELVDEMIHLIRKRNTCEIQLQSILRDANITTSEI
jgi:hypothetical protein